MKTRLDILLHPARLLILQTILQNDGVSAGDLTAMLSDLPQPSVYRHLRILREAGIVIASEGETPRGRREMKYSAAAGGDSLDADEFMQLGHEGRTAIFLQFQAQLQAAFAQWSASGEADIRRDGVGFRQAMLWLNQHEFKQMTQELGQVLNRYTSLPKGNDRRLRSISTVVLPRTFGENVPKGEASEQKKTSR